MKPPQRKIIHIDMDCFYAAVEMRDRPDLRNRPMAVGGSPEGRGVITTANYKAREYGVRSALSGREALRRCPDLVILPNRFAKYKEVSAQVREVFQRYTDLIEPLSLDEAYLDVTDSKHFEGNATKLARTIRQEIYEKTQCTASAGISNSKFLAKIASDWKKPNGQFTIQPKDIPAFIKSLPVKKIPGVGKVTMIRMNKLEIETCEDLQKMGLEKLNHHFGSFGTRLYDLAHGIDHSTVKNSRTRKSISVENTFSKDISDWPAIKKAIEKLFDELLFRIERAKIATDKFKSLQVKFKTNEFQIYTKEKALPFSKESFVELAQQHFQETGATLRLIGIGCKLDVKSEKKSRRQLRLF